MFALSERIQVAASPPTSASSHSALEERGTNLACSPESAERGSGATVWTSVRAYWAASMLTTSRKHWCVFSGSGGASRAKATYPCRKGERTG
eukprot:scaffold139706_cov93-Phaeocystis_antarctica.AAC.1